MFNKLFPCNHNKNYISVFAKPGSSFFSGPKTTSSHLKKRPLFNSFVSCFVSLKSMTSSCSCSNIKRKTNVVLQLKKYITNEKIGAKAPNTRLKEFLKNYKSEKILNNYKIFNKNQNYKAFQNKKKGPFFNMGADCDAAVRVITMNRTAASHPNLIGDETVNRLKSKTPTQQRTNKAVLHKQPLDYQEAQNSLTSFETFFPAAAQQQQEPAAHIKKGQRQWQVPVLKLDKKLGCFLKKLVAGRDNFNLILFQRKANKMLPDMAVFKKNQQKIKNKSKAKNFFDFTQKSQTPFENKNNAFYTTSFLLKPQTLYCHALLRTLLWRSQPQKTPFYFFGCGVEQVSLKTTYTPRSKDFLQSLLTKYLETKQTKNQKHLEKKMTMLFDCSTSSTIATNAINVLLAIKIALHRQSSISCSIAAPKQPPFNFIKSVSCSNSQSSLPFRTHYNPTRDESVPSIFSCETAFKAERKCGFEPHSPGILKRTLASRKNARKYKGTRRCSFLIRAAAAGIINSQNNFNKTFLTYWLMPVTGFAFTLLFSTNHNQINSWFPKQALKLDQQNSKSKNNFLHLKGKNIYRCSTFNNLYTQLLYKTNFYNTFLNNITHFTSSLGFVPSFKKGSATQSYKSFSKIGQCHAGFFSSIKELSIVSKSFSHRSLCHWTNNFFYDAALRKKGLNDKTIGTSYFWLSKNYNIGNCLDHLSNKLEKTASLRQAATDFPPLKNLSYLQTNDSFVIQPLDKQQFLNKYLNFIKSKESLKLLKLKIMKLKKSYVKAEKQPFESKSHYGTPLTSYLEGCKAVRCLSQIQKLAAERRLLKKPLLFTENQVLGQRDPNVQKIFLSLNVRNVIKNKVENKTKFLSYFLQKKKNKISKNGLLCATEPFFYIGARTGQLFLKNQRAEKKKDIVLEPYVPKLILKGAKQAKAVNSFIIVKNRTQYISDTIAPKQTLLLDRFKKKQCLPQKIKMSGNNCSAPILNKSPFLIWELATEKQLKWVLKINQKQKNKMDSHEPHRKLKNFKNQQYKLKIKEPASAAEQQRQVVERLSRDVRLPLSLAQKKAKPFSRKKSICAAWNNVLSISFKYQKMLKKTPENLKNLIQNQKKRRAKKQKLETRRQKKRTRFFPRPIWLRNRLFLNFVNKRKLSSFNQLFSDNKNKILVLGYAQKQARFYRLKFPQIVDGSSQARSSVFRLENPADAHFKKGQQQRVPAPILKKGSVAQSISACGKATSGFTQVRFSKETKKKALAILTDIPLKNKKSVYAVHLRKFLLESTKNNVLIENKIMSFRNFGWPLSEDNLAKFYFSQTCKHASPAVPLLNKSPFFIAGTAKELAAAAAAHIKKGQQQAARSCVFFKTEKNRQTKLHNLKINKNYFNFHEEKTNNPQINQKQKNRPYINFWIWAYNLTTDSNKPFFIWLLPTSVKEAVIKPLLCQMTPLCFSGKPFFYRGAVHGAPLLRRTAQSCHLFKKHRTILRIYWALNKTNTNTITDSSKRYNLWATQKLRNQSKNNKTKSLEKQFITNWTTIKLFPIDTISPLKEEGRQIQKKQLQYKKLTLFSKQIKTKLREKKQKLDYLTTVFFNNKNMKFSHSLFKNKNLHTILPSQDLKRNIAALTNIKKNTTSSTLLLFNKSLKKEPPTAYFFISCCILLHLCALITLVSISQIRCFVKFHIILITKLSNLYSPLIQNIVKKLLINIKFLKTTHTQQTMGYKLQSIVPAVYLSTALQTTEGRSKKTKWAAKQATKKGQRQLLNQKPVFAHGTIKELQSTLLKNDLKQKQQEQTRTAHFLFKAALIKYKEYPKWSSLKKEPKGIKTRDTQIHNKRAERNTKRHRALSNDCLTRLRSSKPKSLFFNVFSKFNIVTTNQLPYKKRALPFFYRGAIHAASRLNNESKEITALKKRPKAKNQLKLEYKLNQSIFLLKQRINGFVKSYKNKSLRLLFKCINIFQTVVRTISTFFEKPAEFTTTWIAFGFLVEWSSDLITIIPENIDSYIWSTFSKTVRFIPIKILFDLNTETMTRSHLSKNVLIYSLLGVGVNKISNITPISLLESPIQSNFAAAQLLPFGINRAAYAVVFKNNWHNFLILTLSHLFQRRVLFLFSTLKDTLNQPDTDLILRQQKGTLFWDIWADFLVTAADYYNVNVAALSAIKTEQNTLIEKLSKAPASLWLDRAFVQDPNFNLQQQLHTPKTDLSKSRSVKYDWRNACFSNKSGSALNFYFTTAMQHLSFFQASPTQQAKMLHMQNQQHFIFNSKPGILNYQSKKRTTYHGSIADRWTVNQFITYQTYKNFNNSNSDLFIDFHTPKAFLHIPTVKYNNIIQQPIGALVCQINSGLFTKQNSKNILLVKTESTDYSVLLIQALAGETELKIITDNAHRYALVNRGFAIGIKLLRDVFFAIALNTPCIFLLEDLHAIGERRPMLISDFGEQDTSEASFAKTSNFSSAGKQEVHEKNQVVYQLTRHAITDYKKPFKGDYSLTIPTNLYSLDLFLKTPTQSTSNLSLISHNNLSLKNKINLTKENKKRTAHKETHKEQTGFITSKRMKKTRRSKDLTPPSTSPFSVLLLKEEKKLKPNKIVEDISWAGLPYRVDETKLRTSYSVRAKVAMLAELSLSNISAKLDMITDLLVIIDSVRSNKGFVVFATTNLPHVLDPALRRPGRFDETICLQEPATAAALIKKGQQREDSAELASHGKTALKPLTPLSLNTKQAFSRGVADVVPLWETMEIKNSTRLQETHPLFAQAGTSFWLSNSISLAFIAGTANKKTSNIKLLNAVNETVNFNNNPAAAAQQQRVPCLNNNNSQAALISYTKKLKHKKHKILIKQIINRTAADNLNKKETNLIGFSKAIAYYEVGKIMLWAGHKSFGMAIPKLCPKELSLNIKSMNYLSLFGLKNKIILQLMCIFGGKIGQFLSQPPKDSQLATRYAKQPRHKMNPFDGNNKYIDAFDSRNSEQKLLKYFGNADIQKTLNRQNIFEIFDGNDNSIKLATSLMLSFMHKRSLYLKNLIVPKLLSFSGEAASDGMVLEEPPCPPFSNLLIPAKRFENYKRVFRDSFVVDSRNGEQGQRFNWAASQRKAGQNLSIEKQLDYTQLNKTVAQQAASEGLKPPVENFITNISKNRTAQSWLSPNKIIWTASAVLAASQRPLENVLETTTNINWYYQNLILKRHGQYLTNQWWNGQLSEHNPETVFLSDIDWRSSFIKKPNQGFNLDILNSRAAFREKNVSKPSTQATPLRKDFDILLDFPDTEQYYNPHRRRWLLNKGYWSFWFNFDKVYSEEIVTTWIFESIIQTYLYLHNNTEFLDFVVSKFMDVGLVAKQRPISSSIGEARTPSVFDYSKTEISKIKEILFITSFNRFN